ncbi:hypothetical protein [Propionibacterium australiense]|uniref:Uncharacterized protein n=1 Tax=Propionibacterium australiense TaxID=119981 RepID=A0A8B3FRY3_9ACTN|nr:hypothetical protein [Propionibacterium australiense]RLP08920.1 hypothetical protein D7U36_08920 [Propionibacterium australiense]
MSESVLVAVVTASLTLIGTAIASLRQAHSTEADIQGRITNEVLEVTAATYKDLSDEVRYLRDRDAEKEERIKQLEFVQRTLLDRDSLWQAGWDDLRSRWPWWREREDPPPYPTPKPNTTT